MGTTKLLVAKAVLAAIGVTGGGAALAAATGHLPSQLGGMSATGNAVAASASATGTPSATGNSKSHPTASPSPSLRGLCRAYTAGVSANPGKALDNPAFTALITAAGGKDKVAAFCASVLAAKPGHAPASHPTGKPTSHPAGKPTSLPTAANTAHPTGKPTTAPAAHPTGQPVSVPAGGPTSHP